MTQTDHDLCPSQTGHQEGWSRNRLAEQHCTPPKVVGSSLLCSFLCTSKQSNLFKNNPSASYPFLGQPPHHHLPGPGRLSLLWALASSVYTPVCFPQLPEEACEYLSWATSLLCLEPSLAPSLLRAKAESPCCSPQGPAPIPTLPFMDSGAAIIAIWLVLKYSRNIPASGPLHRLSPWPSSPGAPPSPPSGLLSNVAS